MTSGHIKEKLNYLENEFKNFQEIASRIKPSSGEFPRITGIDVYGEVNSLNQVVGGDHIVYVDFNQRYDLDTRISEVEESGNFRIAEALRLNKRRAGILVSDVSGHNLSDAMLSGMLHQSFLIGVLYELQQHGEVTLELFENLNTRFFNSSSFKKFITLIYGEIYDDGKFRFLNAGQPPPLVFSNRFDRLVKISFKSVVNVQPIGTLPSREDIDVSRNFSRLGYKQRYTTNEINLMGNGDILLLYTDGLYEHQNEKGDSYVSQKLEKTLQQIKERSAREIFSYLNQEIMDFAKPMDDISLVVIKKI